MRQSVFLIMISNIIDCTSKLRSSHKSYENKKYKQFKNKILKR